MAEFTPSKKTAQDFNDGIEYIDGIDNETGDVVQAETINSLIESQLWVQEAVENVPLNYTGNMIATGDVPSVGHSLRTAIDSFNRAPRVGEKFWALWRATSIGQTFLLTFVVNSIDNAAASVLSIVESVSAPYELIESQLSQKANLSEVPLYSKFYGMGEPPAVGTLYSYAINMLNRMPEVNDRTFLTFTPNDVEYYTVLAKVNSVNPSANEVIFFIMNLFTTNNARIDKENTFQVSQTIKGTLGLLSGTPINNIPSPPSLSFYVGEDGEITVTAEQSDNGGNLVFPAKDGTIALLDDIKSNGSNPNLLRNSNFKINPRGQTSYSGAVYGLSGWKGATPAAMVNVSENGISFSNTSANNTYLKQILKGFVGKTLTLSASILGVTGTARLAIYYSTNATTWTLLNAKSISAIGISSVTATVPAEAVYVSADVGAMGSSTVQYEWVKLEEGSVATSYSTPNYADDLQKCEYYFKRIKSALGNSFQTLAVCCAETATQFRFVVGGVMNRVPTLTFNGNFSVISSSAASNTVTDISVVNESTFGVVVRVTVTNNVTRGECGILQINNDATAYIDLDAEF